MKKVAIIGGGPSGVASAIELKRLLGNNINITIFEKNERILKKVLSTGNGKCNLSNEHIDETCFNDSFVLNVINNYNTKEIKDFFNSLGMYTKTDSSGRIYPITESASTVVDILKRTVDELEINTLTNEIVKSITPKENKYEIVYSKKDVFDYLIVSTGGTSSSFLGSNGEGYGLLSKLGVKINKPIPGLVGLKVKKEEIKGLDGLRQKVTLKIESNNMTIFKEYGEIQFKSDGISGIVVMNASRYIPKYKDCNISIDLLPEVLECELRDFFNKFNHLNKLEALKGLLPKMLAELIYKNTKETDSLIKTIKNYKINIIGDYGFDRSQVTIGGVSLDEMTKFLELKKYKNIYVVGELLDIDGKCGGYNLHFALSSGLVAANNIKLDVEYAKTK